MLKNIINLFWMSNSDAIRNIIVCTLSKKMNEIHSSAVDAFYGSASVRNKVNSELAEYGISIEATPRGLLFHGIK